MKKVLSVISLHFRAIAVVAFLVFAITAPTTGCALYCKVFPCSDNPTDYTTVTAKTIGSINVAAKTAMTVLKYELVPSGRVSADTEAKIAKVYDDYVETGKLVVDLLIINNVQDANVAFVQFKEIYRNLLVLLRSVGVLDSPTLAASDKKLLVPYPATAYVTVEKGK